MMKYANYTSSEKSNEEKNDKRDPKWVSRCRPAAHSPDRPHSKFTGGRPTHLSGLVYITI